MAYCKAGRAPVARILCFLSMIFLLQVAKGHVRLCGCTDASEPWLITITIRIKISRVVILNLLLGTRCKVLVGVAWGLSALFASPMFFISGVPEGLEQCWITFPEPYHWKVSNISITLPNWCLSCSYTRPPIQVLHRIYQLA